MNVKRRFTRFTTQLNGQYFLKEMKKGWQECTITVVSRKGLGAEFHTREIIKPGSTAQIEISVPGELEPITVKGILRWIKKKGNMVSCCTDGLRPVIFKLERIED